MKTIAIVGCGGIGNAHARAWSALPEVKVAFCVDVDKGRAEQMASGFGAAALTDPGQLPDAVDIVSVATHPESHYAITRNLLKKGKHVFCEKPLTMRYNEGAELEAMAREAGVKLGVGFKMRYEPIFRKARELVGELGKIYQVQSHKVQAYGQQPWLPTTGAMFELSVHDFDLIHYILDTRPVAVHAARMSQRLGWPREDGFMIQAEFANGATGTLCGLYVEKIRWTGRDFSLWIAGENGYLQIDRGDRIVLHQDSATVYDFAQTPMPNTFELELADFLQSVTRNTPEPVGAGMANAATWLVEQAWEKGHRENV